MKKYYRLIPLLLFYILIGCNEVDTSEQESISAGVIFQTARELSKEKGLEGLAYGGNRFPGIRRLEFALDTEKYSLKVDEARKLIIYSTEKFLKNINASEKLKPYLKKYPFKVKHVVVKIYFAGKKADYPSPPYLYKVIVDQEQISYYYKGHQDTSYKDPLVHKESYKQAKEIVSAL